MNKKRVAFIGLGVMGYPMAGWLKKKEFEVIVYNRTSKIAENWVNEYNGEMSKNIKDMVSISDFILTCIGNDNDLKEVYFGTDGILENAKEGSVIIDHTTASADIAREIYNAAKAKNISFIDAPISGGQQGAVNGKLTIMCGGEKSAFDSAQSIMGSYSKTCSLLGPSGAGQLTKMVNQICIAGVVQALSEGLHFAELAGLDSKQVIDVISKGAAQSWQMENRHATMISNEYDHGFAVDWMRKDLGICLQQARKIGATLPVAALVDQFYADVQKMGGGRWDTSSLLTRLKK